MKKMIVIAMLLLAKPAWPQQAYITVKADGYVRNQTLIEAVLQKQLFKNKTYRIVNKRTGKSAPLQLLDSIRVLFVLPDVLGPAGAATYQLEETKAGKKADLISVEKSDKGLLVKVQGKNVLFYNTAVINPPDTLPAFYARSGFIHPLFSPAGKIVTDDFPVGHAHQHGIMAAWVNTEFKARPLDFWNQQQKTGSARHVDIESIEPGTVATIIKLRLEQYSLTAGTVLKERWTLTVYPFTTHYLFDLQSTQRNSTADTLYIKKYHYGSIAFRGSRQWNDMDSVYCKGKWNILTDSGFTLADADGKRAAYVSASGTIDGATAGVVVFGFPTNYRYPQPIRVHPQMPYWGFAPAALGSFTINPGAVYTSRYRYFVYDGHPDEARVKSINNDLVHPVQVSVSYKKIKEKN